MKEESKKLKEYIEGAENILVLTHLDPDGDAIASSLITSYVVRKYFKKPVTTNLNNLFKNSSLKSFNWGEEYKKINLVDKKDNIDLSSFDLIIMVDIAEIDECLLSYTGLLEHTKLISIDHHQIVKERTEMFDLSINNLLSSAAEQMYRTFREIFPEEFRTDKYLAMLAQVGIFTDTGSFIYKETSSDTFRLMGDLRDINPISINDIKIQLYQITYNSSKVFEELLKNLVKRDDYCYTVLSKDFFESSNLTQDDRKDGFHKFMNGYIMELQDINWGFVVKESLDKDNSYHFSFRSKPNTKDVGKLSIKLNGGGHFGAAGATIEADSVDEAIKIVIEASK